MWIYTYTHMYIHICVFVWVCVFVCLCVCVCMWQIRVCIYAYFIWEFIYIDIFTCMYKSSLLSQCTLSHFDDHRSWPWVEGSINKWHKISEDAACVFADFFSFRLQVREFIENVFSLGNFTARHLCIREFVLILDGIQISSSDVVWLENTVAWRLLDVVFRHMYLHAL